MARKPSAGEQLRARLDAELRQAEVTEGRALEWTPRELQIIDSAAAAADRAVELRKLLDEELARAEPRASSAAKLAAELRMTERAAVDLSYRVSVGSGAPKSERHVRAAQARWSRAKPVA